MCLSCAVVVLTVVATSSAWGVWRSAQGGGDASATDAALGSALESMLASGDVSGVRRAVAELARKESVISASVTLADGRVLAHNDTAKITAHALPSAWDGDLPENQSEAELSGDGIALTVAGRGSATLLIERDGSVAGVSVWQATWGYAVSGAVGLLLLLALYRVFRRRLAGVGSIREALVAMQDGEMGLGALCVADSLGPEAQVWNALLSELEDLRAAAAETEVAAHVDRRRGQGLEHVTEAMWHGIVLVDDGMNVSYTNGAAGALLGGGGEAVVGRPITDVLAIGSAQTLVESAIRDGAHGWRSAEIERDGGGVLRVSVRRVRRTDGASALILLEDVSQRRVADAAKEAFVANATHELRTPLTNMRMYIETALDEGETDSAVRAQALNVINSEIRRLERIVGDMLSVAEIESGSLTLRLDDVRLDALIQEAHDDFVAQAAEKGVGMRLAMAPKLPVLRGDRDRVALAVHNLLGNAIKYTPSGGSVTLTVETTNGGVSIAVSDTGIGIPEPDQARIFEQFYRANDSRLSSIPGSGLGLALAREIARRHGGDITVESVVDQGSTFTLWLPERADAPSAIAA